MSDEVPDTDKLGMTNTQWETFQRLTRGYGEQDANGIDLSLLRANLKLTPTECFDRMQYSLHLMQEVRRAGHNAGLHDNSDRS